MLSYSSQLKALLSESQVQLVSAKAEAQEQRAELSLVSLTSLCLMLHMKLSTLSDSCALQVKQELQEVTRRIEGEKSTESTQVNTGCACIHVY